jgi:hypothetical protein
MQTACWASGINFSKIGESARRHGECGRDCEKRAAEWKAIRPLLVSAPNLLAVLGEAEICWGDEFASDNPIDGGDLVEWFGQWLPTVRIAIAAAQGQEAGAAGEATVPGRQ